MNRAAFAPLALLVGALLAAPAAEGEPRIPPGAKVHVVYPGQTLAMIAKRYNVSVEELVKANRIRKGRPIQPKQKLVIPGKEADVIPAAMERTTERTEAKSQKAEDDAPNDDPGKSPTGEKPGKKKKKGYLNIKSYTGSWSGQAVKKGTVTKAGRQGIDRVLASWRTGQNEKINERLIRLLTKVSDHFGGKPIRVVSGFRPYTASQFTPHSRHNSGHAVDFSIPGVANTAIRDYCKTLPNVGVGFYPNSSFVHLDARETSTYWVDYSGPGEAPRYANGKGRDPGHDANEERDQPASTQGDGASSADDDTPNDI
jgi:uncharacterized protein YcbK (DUF882 family)